MAGLETRVRQLEAVLSEFAVELRLALRYVNTDAASSLTKSRVVLEKLLLRIYQAEMGQEPRKGLLGDMLNDNQFTRRLERRIVSRMNSIRDMGNLGPHGEPVQPSDAARVLDDLCEVLDWYLGRTSTAQPGDEPVGRTDGMPTAATDGSLLPARPGGDESVADKVTGLLLRRLSVNLVVGGGADWRATVQEVTDRLAAGAKDRVALIDLHDPLTATRKGLLDLVLTSLGLADGLPDKPHDLVEFGKRMRARPFAYVVLAHFDDAAIPERRTEYGADLFNTLRWYTTDERKLALLLVSRRPLGALLPKDHPLSELDARTVELGTAP
jgi:hypothetical protein